MYQWAEHCRYRDKKNCQSGVGGTEGINDPQYIGLGRRGSKGWEGGSGLAAHRAALALVVHIRVANIRFYLNIRFYCPCDFKKIENLSFNSTCPEQRRYALGKIGDLVGAPTSSWADARQWGVTFLKASQGRLRRLEWALHPVESGRPQCLSWLHPSALSEPQQFTTSLSLSSLIHKGGVITLPILLIWKCFSGCKSLNRYQGLFYWWQEAFFVGFEQETDRSEWSFER